MKKILRKKFKFKLEQRRLQRRKKIKIEKKKKKEHIVPVARLEYFRALK